MLIKGESGGGSPLTGVLILLVGVAIGLALDPQGWLESRTASELDPLGTRVAQPSGPLGTTAGVALVENGLETLHLRLDDDAVQRLQRSHDRAVARGRILQSSDDVFAAQVEHGGRSYRASARLKGDLLDHVDTDKWSLRIELEDGTLFGLSRFSIQHPKTRGSLWGWLVLEAARYDGLLAPRARFVNVVINDRPNGIYELEEHFSKELLESQGRREGPIVRFNEDAHWSLDLTQRTAERRLEPSVLTAGADVLTAELEAFGERRLARSEPLNRQLQASLAKMRELQRSMAVETAGSQLHHAVDHRPGEGTRRERAAQASAAAPARLQAASEQVARSVEELLDVDRFARMVALLTVFGGEHGLTWHNLRFYRDPLRDRLEPVVFDADPGSVARAAEDPYVWGPRLITRVLARSPRYYRATFRALGELSDPAWLERFLASVGPGLRVASDALHAEGLLAPGGREAAVVNLLRHRQVELRRLLAPEDAVNFLCHVEREDASDPGGGPEEAIEESVEGSVVVEAWGTTRVPMRLDGFRLSNGTFLSAADVHVARPGDGALLDGDHVVLPWDGRRVLFRFPVDTRLATLREIRQLTEAIRQRTERDRVERLTIDAEYRPTAAAETRSERLLLRRFPASWSDEGGRPPQPTLADALARHPFLSYDPERGELAVAPGTWTVEGDLLVPDGHALYAGPGVQLLFARDAVLLARSPLVFEGSADAPVELRPADGDGSWSGLLVLDSREKSTWTHVHVSRAREILRGGWMSTGGVTFYRSPVEMRGCRFEDARGEDALNVFGAALLLDGVAFAGSASDAFDGDFVTGTVRDCTFDEIGADALDTSGSRLTVEGCSFASVADKAISAGEESELLVRGGTVATASIGVASKDGSRVDVADLAIDAVDHFGLAAYVKKAEYGPSAIAASRVRIGTAGSGPTLVQTDCEVLLDGEPQPTRDVDVDALYAEKILGQ